MLCANSSYCITWQLPHPFSLGNIDCLVPQVDVEKGEYKMAQTTQNQLMRDAPRVMPYVSEKFGGYMAPKKWILVEALRGAKGIPSKATHFCLCMPLWGVDEIELENADELATRSRSDSVKFMMKGGFAFLDENGNVLACGFIDAGTSLQFGSHFKWDSNYTGDLCSQNRISPITILSLREAGARFFAWVGPDEELQPTRGGTPWTPFPSDNAAGNSGGGYVYWFSNNAMEGTAEDRCFALLTRAHHKDVATVSSDLNHLSPESSWFFKSTYIYSGLFPVETQAQERKRHSIECGALSSCVLVPHSPTMVAWHILQVFVMVFLFLDTPMCAAFGKTYDVPRNQQLHDLSLYLIEVLLFADAVRFLFTATYVRALNGQGVLVYNPLQLKLGAWGVTEERINLIREESNSYDDVSLVVRKGFPKWKTFCVLASGVPFARLMQLMHPSGGDYFALRFLQFPKLLLAGQVHGICTRAVEELPPKFPFNSTHLRFISTVLNMASATHIVASILYAVGERRTLHPECDFNNDCGWVDTMDWPSNVTRSERYATAYYYGFTIMSTVGFGDISASNPMERIVTVCIMLYVPASAHCDQLDLCKTPPH